jgi:hypothetical protein
MLQRPGGLQILGIFCLALEIIFQGNIFNPVPHLKFKLFWFVSLRFFAAWSGL